MLNFLPGPLKGSLIVLLVILNTAFWMPLLISCAVFKAIFPLRIIQKIMTKLGIGIATNWISFNSALFSLFHKIEWDIRGLDGLDKNGWYLVNANHQSWADIPIAQKVLNRKVPMLKFFLKQELIWLPLLGLCWWALDFPFMKRSTPAQIKKNPALAGKDLEATKKACEKFKTTPVSVFNFMEGTRFTEEKHSRQNSPFKNLLKPKAGGTAFTLGSMGDQLNTMLDITIVYPTEHYTAWDLACGRLNHIVVDIRQIEIPKEFLGRDYMGDRQFKIDFQQWLNDVWVEKDQRIEELKAC